MAGNGNDFLPNYVEHIVPLKETKLVLPRKLILYFGAAILVLTALTLILVFNFLAPIFAVMLILVAYLVWYFSRYASVEFEYTIHQGEISFDIVYGRKQRKPYYSTPLNRIERIAPLVDGAVPEADLRDAEKEVFCASRKKSPYARYAVVRGEDGKKTILYFEVTEKAEKVLHFFNARAFLK